MKNDAVKCEEVKNRVAEANKNQNSDVQYGRDSILQYLQTQTLGRNILFFEETDSTNLQAQLAAMQGAADGTLVVADKQTAGRGRRGRNWESPAVGNIYFTLLLTPDFAPEAASKLTLLMAYAVKCALERYVPCAIKWPNDIVVDGKKICGILTELRLEGTAIHHVVIGVGINVGRQEFAAELADKATGLEEACTNRDIVISRSRIIADVLKVFEEEYEAYISACEGHVAKCPSRSERQALKVGRLEDFIDKYNDCLVNKDREVCVLDPKGEYRGIARGINREGELLVELPDGTVNAVYAGEVSVRGVYGYV